MFLSMFHGAKDDYIQVVVHHEQYEEKMRAMGWVESVDDLGEDSAVDPLKIDHHSTVSGFLDKDAVESYIKEHFGVDIDKRGSLETVKEKALAVINESGRSDS